MIYEAATPDYPEELEAYVQEYMSRLDPVMAYDEEDPEHNEFKNDLYALKQVYPDKSYEELNNMMNGIEDDKEYAALFHPDGHMNRIERTYLIVAAGIVILVVCIIVKKTCKEKSEYLDKCTFSVRKSGNRM